MHCADVLSMPTQGPTWNSHWAAARVLVRRSNKTGLRGGRHTHHLNQTPVLVICHCLKFQTQAMVIAYLSIGTRDLDAGVQAGTVVRLDNVALHDLAGTDTAVVRALGRREAVRGPGSIGPVSNAPKQAEELRINLPAIGALVQVQKGVLLLEAEPGDVVGVGGHELGRLVAVVVLVGGAIGIPALGEDQDVLAETDRVGVDCYGLEVDVRVVARGLARRGAIKVPHREVLGLVVLLGEGLRGAVN